ncbi:MAG: transposase [Myxococcota bacterium]
MFDRIRSVEGGPGRPASDPRVLLALWLFALSNGVTSSREIAQLTVEHRAYEWIRGGVPIDYHLLSDFRSEGAEVLDHALTAMLVGLRNAGVISLEELAIDGLRTRANAAGKSFLTAPQVQELQRVVQQSREEGDKAGLVSATRSRQEAGRARREQEESEQLARAHSEFEALAAARAASLRRKGARGLTAAELLAENGWVAATSSDPASHAPEEDDAQLTLCDPPKNDDGETPASPAGTPPSASPPADPETSDAAPCTTAPEGTSRYGAKLRVSTTDPKARVMKMGDGGYRPAYNLQLVTETGTGLIVAALVGTHGSDQPHLEPLLDDVHKRLGVAPTSVLADGNYFSADNVARVAQDDGMLYCPPPRGRKSEDRYKPSKKDTKALAAWRSRMATPESQSIYKRRAQHAELTNARLRNNDVRQLRTRTPQRIRGELLLHVLAVNMRILGYDTGGRAA